MNKQQLIDSIKNSSLTADRKQQILALLENNDLTFDIKEQIKDLIQEDIDLDTTVPFTAEDYSAMAVATDQMSNDIAAVEDELNRDMSFVENELNDLENTVNSAADIIDETQLEAVRHDIQQ